MLAMNDRMGALWWLQYEIRDGEIAVQGHWRQDNAKPLEGSAEDLPCYHIVHHGEIVIGPPRKGVPQMRLRPHAETATSYAVADWIDGPPESPEVAVPPPPEFSGYDHMVIRQLTGEGDYSEFCLPEASARNLIRTNRDLVKRGAELGSDPDYVAREIVKRVEGKGVEVPRQEIKEPEEDHDDD